MNKTLTSLFAALALTVFSQSVVAQAMKGDAKAGEAKNAMCIGCHGIKGYQASFPEVYKVPMISGQSGAYIASALKAYQEGTRKHPTMGAIAASLSDKDMADLGAYYEQHGKAADAVAVPAKPVAVPSERAAKLMKAANCASCHGDNFSKPLDGTIPKLAGQHKDYMLVASKAYLSPDKAKVGRNHAAMGGMLKAQRDIGAKEFDAQLKDTIDYISKLPGDLSTTPQSKFR